MTDKYDICFSARVRSEDAKRLVNQLWKLIPMRENNEDWQSHLTNLIEEISGLVEIYKYNVSGLILLAKLEGLFDDICNDFILYRRTVFKCMSLISEVLNDEE